MTVCSSPWMTAPGSRPCRPPCSWLYVAHPEWQLQVLAPPDLHAEVVFPQVGEVWAGDGEQAPGHSGRSKKTRGNVRSSNSFIQVELHEAFDKIVPWRQKYGKKKKSTGKTSTGHLTIVEQFPMNWKQNRDLKTKDPSRWATELTADEGFNSSHDLFCRKDLPNAKTPQITADEGFNSSHDLFCRKDLPKVKTPQIITIIIAQPLRRTDDNATNQNHTRIWYTSVF